MRIPAVHRRRYPAGNPQRFPAFSLHKRREAIYIAFIQQQIQLRVASGPNLIVEQNHSVFQRITGSEISFAVFQKKIIRREASDIQHHRFRVIHERVKHGGRRRIRLRVANHIGNADGIRLIPVHELHDPISLEIIGKLFCLGAKMCRRQSYRQLDIVELLLADMTSLQFLRNGNQRKYKETIIFRLVLAERDALVGERVVIAPVLQALPEGFCNALLQPGNKRVAVDGFDLLVAMINTNQYR